MAGLTPYTLAQNSDNIMIGPCFVFYNYVHLGLTYGGVTVSVTQNTYQLKSDQYGDVPVKTVDAGVNIEVTVNLTETSVTTLTNIFATGTAAGAGLSFGKPVGTEISGKELVLEPSDRAQASLPNLIQIYEAVPNIGGAIEIAFTTDKQRVYAVKFAGLIQPNRTSGDQLFRIGNYSSH